MNITNKDLKISIVVPLYNEESNISFLFERLESILENLCIRYEIICVNDGSKDNTLQYLIGENQRNNCIKVINLSRNFGKEIALTAGIDYSSSDAVIPIDADLQDPPELIEELVDKWQEGYDVVYATRKSRSGESWLKRLTAANFYSFIGKTSDIYIPPNTITTVNNILNKFSPEKIVTLPAVKGINYLKLKYKYWNHLQKETTFAPDDPRFLSVVFNKLTLE